MNLQKILDCEKEAIKFLHYAKEVKARAKDDKFTFFGCKETGALKRQSMELTNSLANLRK